MTSKPIAIVADFNAANSSHRATNLAIEHVSGLLGATFDVSWVATDQLTPATAAAQLKSFRGIWIGPASPYRNMEGALAAIRFARECQIPLLGTCGGFQHIIIEYARNVLGLLDAEHEESQPGASQLVISRLACSLVGRTMTVTLQPGSVVAGLYGQSTTEEQYLCNFGVNPGFVDRLRGGRLQGVGSDLEGVIRAVEMKDHPFFIGTLFLPQLSSSATRPHPLISGFLKACQAKVA